MTPVRIGVAVSASYTRYEGTASASVRMPVSGSWVVQEKTRVCPSSTCEGHPILGYPSPTFRCSPHPSSASVVPHAPRYVPSIKRNMGLCLRHQPSVVWLGSGFTVASIGESGSHHRHVLHVGVRMTLGLPLFLGNFFVPLRHGLELLDQPRKSPLLLRPAVIQPQILGIRPGGVDVGLRDWIR